MKQNELKKNILDTLGRWVDFGEPEEYYRTLMDFSQQFNQDLNKKRLFEILEAIGNNDRFKILDALRQKDRCVCELEAILQKSQSGVSHHIKILQNVKLIHGWKKGKFTHYSLIQENFEYLVKEIKKWVNETKNWFNVENILGI